MSIYHQIIDVCTAYKGQKLTSSEIKNLVNNKFNTNTTSVIPSDYCYNRLNKGIKFNRHIFILICQNEYKYVGENFIYTGLIYSKPIGILQEQIVGEWNNGEFQLYRNSTVFVRQELISKQAFQNNTKGLEYLNQIQKLYEEYIKILRLEVSIMGIKPTEVRHLIGRIGEFKCALHTHGTLANIVNQQGFDVISENKKNISVKTTAQKTGFISINKNTIGNVDELMS